MSVHAVSPEEVESTRKIAERLRSEIGSAISLFTQARAADFMGTSASTVAGGSGWGAFSLDCNNFKRRGMYLFAAHWLRRSVFSRNVVDQGQPGQDANCHSAHTRHPRCTRSSSAISLVLLRGGRWFAQYPARVGCVVAAGVLQRGQNLFSGRLCLSRTLSIRSA